METDDAPLDDLHDLLGSYRQLGPDHRQRAQSRFSRLRYGELAQLIADRALGHGLDAVRSECAAASRRGIDAPPLAAAVLTGVATAWAVVKFAW